MLSAERRNLILREVHEKKKVFVNELSRRFEVSEETIRRDLDKLDKDGYVIKGYGGAVLNEDYGTDLPFNMRCEINPGKKSQIAELAVEEIEPGDHIFMDASSTTVFLSRAVRKKETDKLTVITNSIENAVTLGNIPGAQIMLTGGILKFDSMSLTGGRALEDIRQYHMSKAFISCNGLDIDRGVTEGNDEVAGVKQAAINASDRVYLVVDSEKFKRASFAQVCSLDRVDVLITDKKPDARWLEVLEQKNIRTVYPG